MKPAPAAPTSAQPIADGTGRLAAGARSHIVRTPEQVEFRYELAGPVERMAAWLVDFLCMVGFVGALFWALSKAGEWAAPLQYMGIFAVQCGYFLWFEWRWHGATPGKRMMGIRVIQGSGVRCSLERLALRNFLRMVDFLPFLYALGGVSMLLSRSGVRIGDLAAGTVCVRVPAAPPPSAVAEITRRFNSLRDDAAVRGRIRQSLRAEEARVVTTLALRRDLLEAGARTDLFARCAAYLRRRLRLDDRHAGLPDESLVLNVGAVLLDEKEI